MRTYGVAPLTGAWIEMSVIVVFPPKFFVAPLAGAWIEIVGSHPLHA